MKKPLLFLMSHGLALAIGFAGGIYALPILIEPEGPSREAVEAVAKTAHYKATIKDGLKGSDFLHWGKGDFSISSQAISLMGEVSPGPDYKLYLTPKFVEDEDGFLQIKEQALQVGDIKTFDNFIVTLPPNTDITAYNSVVVWCERFGEFITAAQYRNPGAGQS
ncbi:MAG: DM13 domain-containing protein [Cohaesibacter sp.]|nr:DM13 domain-containing protein [Cohaesibacter sp.]